MILPKNFLFQNIKIKLKFKNLINSEVLSSDFPGLKISAASMTSVASTAAIASMTSTASFHQKIYWFWWLDHPWHQYDQYWPPSMEWIIKNAIFHWYLVPFLLEAVEASWCYFFEKIVVVPKNSLSQHSRTIFKPSLTYIFLSIRANS